MLSPKQILDIAAYAAKIMLTNGAEIYRTEDTITRICQAYGMKYVQAVVTPTGIFISIDDGDGVSETMVRRIKHRNLNLAKISEVNQFSRSIQDKQLDYDTALAMLRQISYGANPYSLNMTIFLSSVGGAANVLLMEASFINLIPAFLASLAAQLVVRKLGFLRDVHFVPEMIAGFICGFISLGCFQAGVGDSLSIIIVSAILPFVPGVSLTNAIRDAVNDDLISASSRGLEAALIAISIAIGVAISLGVFYR